jgi:hypothetical protein
VLASYVLRLVPEELADGRFVGEVEDVATGVHSIIRDVDELVRFCVTSSPAGRDLNGAVPGHQAHRDRRRDQ